MQPWWAEDASFKNMKKKKIQTFTSILQMCVLVSF